MHKFFSPTFLFLSLLILLYPLTVNATDCSSQDPKSLCLQPVNDDTTLTPLEQAIGDMADLSFASQLTILAVGSGKLRWVAWDDNDHTTHLELRSVDHNSLLWSAIWNNAYNPRIILLPQWIFKKNPILALTIQFGATAEQVLLFGIQDQLPILLDEKLAETTGWTLSSHSPQADILVLYNHNSQNTILKPKCYFWENTSSALIAEPCP